MSKTYYLSTTDAGKASLLERLLARLPKYPELGIGVAAIAILQADAVAMRYIVDTAEAAQRCAREWTSYKAAARDGGDGSQEFPPVVISETVAPPAVPLGIMPRNTALVAQIKASPFYTEAMGIDLGIVGSEQIIDPDSWQPDLDLQLQAGQPVLRWTKGKADALEISVARGPQSDFVLLDVSTDPRYLDPTPLPAVPTMWTYKAIYRLHNTRVGEWSKVVSIAVGG